MPGRDVRSDHRSVFPEQVRSVMVDGQLIIRIGPQTVNGLGGPAYPQLEARLLAMQARGFAAPGHADESTALLQRAERVLARSSPGGTPPPWISRFGEGSLTCEIARCLYQLGDLGEAQRQAERIIALRSDDRRRSRALGQLILASVLVARGRPDEACGVAREVLDGTEQLGSHVVIEQLRGLGRLLGPYRDGRVVADFLLCLKDALTERASRYQRLVGDGPGPVRDGRELV